VFSGGLGGGGFPIPIKAGGGVLGIIVLLASLLLPRLLNGSQSAAGVPQASDKSADASDGACNSELEQIVCGATVDVQSYWQANLPTFYGTTYEPTKTVFFTGGTNTGCGQASSQTGPFYCPIDHLVYIDLGFMQALEQQLVGTTSDLAEQYIVAHEYGHHIQNLVGINDQVQQAQQNDPGRANQYSVAMELQADCFAGMWVGDVAARGKLDSAAELKEALDAAAGVGDDRIQQKTQGRIDKESWTHGSAEQRQTWFTRGYNSGDPKQCDTFSEVL
jgi:predicted metalloprotease